jgi:multicomponent Na+:H+ antiporter subunit G
MSAETIVDGVSAILLLAGSFFLVVGAVGLIRMPDVFTRMHATSVSDTLGAGFLILGLVVQAGFTLVSVKLLIILAIFFFTSPLATHALARGALAVGVEPVLRDRNGRKRRKELELIAEFGVVPDRNMPPAKPAEPVKKTRSAPKKSGAGKTASTRRKAAPRGKGGSSSKR